MYEKKQPVYKSPDLSGMTEIIIDHRTRIYVTPGTDIEAAKERYIARNADRRIKT